MYMYTSCIRTYHMYAVHLLANGDANSQDRYLQLVSEPTGLIRTTDRVGGSSLRSWYRSMRTLCTNPAKKTATDKND